MHGGNTCVSVWLLLNPHTPVRACTLRMLRTHTPPACSGIPRARFTCRRLTIERLPCRVHCAYTGFSVILHAFFIIYRRLPLWTERQSAISSPQYNRILQINAGDCMPACRQAGMHAGFCYMNREGNNFRWVIIPMGNN